MSANLKGNLKLIQSLSKRGTKNATYHNKKTATSTENEVKFDTIRTHRITNNFRINCNIDSKYLAIWYFLHGNCLGRFEEWWKGEKGDCDNNILNFMTWIVIAWMVWSAAKVIDNVLSREEGKREGLRARRPMIETIRMNDGKLDMVREFVWSLVVILGKKNSDSKERTSKRKAGNRWRTIEE